MLTRIHPYFSLIILALAACYAPAHAQYISKTKSLTSGQTVTISTSKATQLSIVSHPGSAVSRKMDIAMHSTNYEWTPTRAGIYEISTPGGPTQVVSVKFGYFPVKGLVVLIIAFTVLFGGAAYSSYNVFTNE